jgi:hypothetical protein
MTKKMFSPLSFVAVFASGIRDPGSGMGKNQDPRSGIRDKHPGSATLINTIDVLFRIILHKTVVFLYKGIVTCLAS